MLCVFWLAALFADCGPARASYDYDPCSFDSYSLTPPSGNVPFLASANDSRATLMMLLSDAGLVARPRLPEKMWRWWGWEDIAPSPHFGKPPLCLDTLIAILGENPKVNAYASSGSCSERAQANSGFQEALKASAVPPSEQALLIAARNEMDNTNCYDGMGLWVISNYSPVGEEYAEKFTAYQNAAAAIHQKNTALLAKIGSPAGREFVAYLDAAAAISLASVTALPPSSRAGITG